MALSEEQYKAIQLDFIKGRYITNTQLEVALEQLPKDWVHYGIGLSVKQQNIHKVLLGQGPLKILMWSQMHGNESTTTKAVLDLLHFFSKNSELALEILAKCTIAILPILNPDGAAAYTRQNANEIDLNRDAQERSQPESVLLRREFDQFGPHYCFNLHDQRTIFSAGESDQPATVSFLAPAADAIRSITASRLESMRLIVSMNRLLQQIIPARVGRYDDGFNANCVGDAFQMLNTPTVLIEAGHAPGDYSREQTRKYVFFAVLEGLTAIARQDLGKCDPEEYQNIPENEKLFLDIVVHNVNKINPGYAKNESAGILFNESLIDNEVQFLPYLETRGQLKNRFGHAVLDCNTASDLKFLQKQREIYQLLI